MKTWLFLAILLTGCGTSWDKNDSCAYQLSIDPAWDKPHHDMIWQASQNWQAAVDNLLTFTEVQGFNYPDLILVSPSSMEDLTYQYADDPYIPGYDTLGRTTYEGTSSLVEVAIDLSTDDFKIVSEHEIGHAIGMAHIGPDNIMCKDTYCQSQQLSCGDLDQFCSVWNCNPTQFKLCQ